MRRSTSRAASAILLLAIVAVALSVRVWFQHQARSPSGSLLSPEYDVWHHMRLVDALVHDFPHRIHYDVYGHFGGEHLRTGVLFDLVVAGAALMLSGGDPSPDLIDRAGAWIPALLGAAAVFPMWALGRCLFGNAAGLAAAALFAIMPGGLLRRTSLGFADHHVLEVLFAALTLLSLAYALRGALRGTPPFTPDDAGRTSTEEGSPADASPQRSARHWLGPAAAAGAALGAYLLSWTSGVFLVAILALWLGVEILWRSWTGQPIGPPARIAAVTLVLAFGFVWPMVGAVAGLELTAQVLMGGLPACALLAMSAAPLERLPRRRRLTLLLAASLAVPLAALAIWPATVESAMEAARRLVPSERAATILELQPLLRAPGGAWAEYASALFFALVGIVLAPWVAGRTRAGELRLIIVFATATLAATLAQARFSHYLAIAVALFGGLAFVRLLDWRLPRWIAAPLLFVLLFIPTAAMAFGQARGAASVPAVWVEALRWLRLNTPEPFGDPGSYVQRFPRPPHGRPFAYPSTAYAVLAWWDHGYWIQRIGRRIPTANPAQHGVDTAAAFLLAGSEAEAAAILDRANVRFVIIDSSLIFNPRASSFPAVAIWAGRPLSDFVELCRVPQPDGTSLYMTVYYPAFYESMVSRLWTFGGDAITPKASTWLMRSVRRPEQDGTTSCEITGLGRFATYDDALRANATPEFRHSRIVGISRGVSPVPLERLAAFRAVYQSKERVALSDTSLNPPVLHIFEYER